LGKRWTARWLTIDFERGRPECGTVRVGVHCFLGEGYPHMKMHEYQNKGFTRKAIRKLLKRKKCTYGCSRQERRGRAIPYETARKFPSRRVAQELMEVKDNFQKIFCGEVRSGKIRNGMI